VSSNAVSLKRLAAVMPSNIDKHSVEDERPVSLCNYVDVYKNERITDAIDFMEATATDAQIARFTLQAHDVLVTKDSEEPTDIGIPAYVPEAIPGVVCGYHLAVIRPEPGRLHGAYLHWALQSAEVQTYYATTATGISRYALGIQDLGMTPIHLPSLTEQEIIANFLDEKTARIDALIAEKERLEESLKGIDEVTAFDFVTRGLVLTAHRSSFREDWLREVPSHWALLKLRNIASIGNGSTPKRDNPLYWVGGETPWLNSGSVNASRITEASDYVTDAARSECHLPKVRAGSTVVALTGQGKTRGSASLVEIDTTINQHLAYLSRHDERMSDEYLWVLLTGMYSVLRYISDGEGSTKGALTCEQLNQLRVPVPPPSEQAEIVTTYLERASSIEGLRNHVSEHISLLREYRSSLISAAVTGQLDVDAFKETGS
jgi:type I restriction enzyme S subunit